MSAPVWQVVIADLKASRKVPTRERGELHRALGRAIARVMRVYGEGFRLAPEVLKGDELQAVLHPGAPGLKIVTYLRAQLIVKSGRRVELRAGLGRGPIDRLSSRGPFASDGPAFQRARAALEQARRNGSGRLTGWNTGDAFFDTLARATLGLVDAFESRWTAPQWEAVAGRLEAKALHDIAKEKGVSFQSVSKRLRAAAWNEVQQAIDLLETTIAMVDPEGVNLRGPGAGARPAGRESKHSRSKG